MGAGGPILQTCPACGLSFDHDVPACPDCGERVVEFSRSKILIIVIAVVVALAFLAAIWAYAIDPISPDFWSRP